MQFKVNKNQIIRLDKELLTTENVNSVECSFSFSEEYDGLDLFAVFYRDDEHNRFVPITDGKCVIPWEMLETAGLLYIGAYGIKNTTDTVEKRITSNAVSAMVLKSLDSSASANAAPTPDLWEQYRAEILGYKAEMLSIKDSVKLDYDVQPARIGVKYKDETNFTYTDDLTGPQGPPSAVGQYIVTGVGSAGFYDNNHILVFDVDLPEITKEVGANFILIPDTSYDASSHIGVGIRLNGESKDSYGSVTGTYYYGDNDYNVGSFHPVAGKPYRMMYDGSAWIATDYTKQSSFSEAVTASGNSNAFTATVRGITSLSNGVSFTMIPNAALATGTATLNVNSLGAKTVYHRTSNGSITGGYALPSGTPVHVTYYTGNSGGCWIVDNAVTMLSDGISGVIPVSKGGTGAINAIGARENLGIWRYRGGITTTESIAANTVLEQNLSAKTIFGFSTVPSNFQIAAGVSLNGNMHLTVAHSEGADEIKVRMQNISGGSVGVTTFYYSIIGMLI